MPEIEEVSAEELKRLKIAAEDEKEEKEPAEDQDGAVNDSDDDNGFELGARIKLPETKAEIDAFLESIPLLADTDTSNSDDMAAINALIEESTPEDRMHSFKEGGNKAMGIATGYLGHSRHPKERPERREAFRQEALKRLRDAAEYYRQALEIRLSPDNPTLRSVVLGNRALAHLHLRQLGHCKSDAAQAVRLNPYNVKAYHRGATAFKELRQFVECERFAALGCRAADEWLEGKVSAEEKMRLRKAALSDELRALEEGASLEGNPWFRDEKGEQQSLVKIMADQEDAVAKQRELLRQLGAAATKELERARAAEEKKRAEAEQAQRREHKRQSDWDLAVKKRGIRIGSSAFIDQASRGSGGGAAADYARKPYVDERTGELHWPVMFLYPETLQSDFVADFPERQSFRSQLAGMFPPAVPSPVWDLAREYQLNSLSVEYEISVKEGLRTLRAQLAALRKKQGLPEVEDTEEALLKMLPVVDSDLEQGLKCVRMQVPLDTSLQSIVSAQGYEVPGIPVFMIRPAKKSAGNK